MTVKPNGETWNVYDGPVRIGIVTWDGTVVEVIQSSQDLDLEKIKQKILSYSEPGKRVLKGGI
jgi:hypothetical protein